MLLDEFGRPLVSPTVPTTPTVSSPEFLRQYQRLRELRKQGVTEEQIRMLGPDLASAVGGGAAEAALGSARQRGAQVSAGAVNTVRRAAPMATAASALLPGAFYATQEAMAGRPAGALTGGLASTAVGGITTALTAGLRAAPHPLAKLAGFALPAITSAIAAPLAGGAAEAAVSAYTGKPPTGKTGTEVAQPPRYIETPLGRINLNDAAAQEDFNNRNQKRQLDYYGTMMGMTTSNLKDLTQFQNDQEINMQKAMLPITTKLANDQLTRAQALVNTQNNAYLQQMTLGAQANLALGAQRERGATMRQALATNPYVVALGAPNISIS
jgi:hypothetical protein